MKAFCCWFLNCLYALEIALKLASAYFLCWCDELFSPFYHNEWRAETIARIHRLERDILKILRKL